MSPPSDLVRELWKLDRTVHEPARLILLVLLAQEEEIAFRRLEELSGLTRGNLASHLKTLEAAAYVTARRIRQRARTATLYSLTRRGRGALDEHLARLRRILATVEI